jgi:DEAD/DEAH box helicase domain-containing protein
MTPDVAHAWLMSNLRQSGVSGFLGDLRLLILDEAHVYEGVFGTNMAYFLRRFQVVSGPHRLICSTATLGEPADFVQKLTGRQPRSFGLEEDHSATPPKTVLLVKEVAGKPFESIVNLLVTLADVQKGRFLAFGDSRRMVEQVVAAAHRVPEKTEEDDDTDDDAIDAVGRGTGNGESATVPAPRILPYRAGYETEDRKEIQKALGQGRLAGVVSTSAMELGLDIGQIDLIVLLNVPPSAKAFWQRIGRGGRKNPGVCLLIDNRGTLADAPGGIDGYIGRPLEPCWLYLENRYIQYTNALCAAFELGEYAGTRYDLSPFESLPASFRRFLDNELNPTETVPQDLYALKQRAQAGPHREFPIRSGIEQDFQVKTPQGIGLGSLTFSQALREAYPGAIYYYMARPYRVYRFRYRDGEIRAKREKHWTTRPTARTMVFPRFQGGILNLLGSSNGFLAETEVQVSERVVGFTEQRGSVKEEHRYGPTSPYFQRDINRFFETTGVCWYFADKYATSEAMAVCLLEAFCLEFGIQERDLGVGLFYSKQSPLGSEKCQGICIYDSTNGSLRLTQRLAEGFTEVLRAAISIARAREDTSGLAEFEALGLLVGGLSPVPVAGAPSTPPPQEDWVTVIAPGGRAIYVSETGTREVEVVTHRYTPQGLMYELVPPEPDAKWIVAAATVQPLFGETRLARVNLTTGEIEAIP